MQWTYKFVPWFPEGGCPLNFGLAASLGFKDDYKQSGYCQYIRLDLAESKRFNSWRKM